MDNERIPVGPPIERTVILSGWRLAFFLESLAEIEELGYESGDDEIGKSHALGVVGAKGSMLRKILESMDGEQRG